MPSSNAKNRDVVAIYGTTGSGKSTCFRQRFMTRDRLVVFDVCEEYDLPTIAASPVDLIRAMKPGKGGFRISYRPTSMDLPLELHRLATALWERQKIDADPVPVTLAIEEANSCYGVNQLPRDQRGMDKLVLQGRHQRVSLVAVTQRPSLISANLRGNLSDIFCFPLTFPEDRRLVGNLIPPGSDVRLSDAPHHFMHWNQGAVENGKNDPP